MKPLYTHLIKQSIWYPEYHPRVQKISSKWRNWLLDKGSLTEKLVAHSNDNFAVRVLSQRWALPLLHEATQLNIPLHLAVRVREVELHIYDKSVVFARSIMPLKIYLQERHTLQNIGTRPLGQLLFRDGKIRVSKRNVAVYRSANHKTIYGRSTPYQYYGNEILVSEYFINEALL